MKKKEENNTNQRWSSKFQNRLIKKNSMNCECVWVCVCLCVQIWSICMNICMPSVLHIYCICCRCYRYLLVCIVLVYFIFGHCEMSLVIYASAKHVILLRLVENPQRKKIPTNPNCLYRNSIIFGFSCFFLKTKKII